MTTLPTIIRPFSDPAAVAQALRLLAADGVIAAPTDTVYGLMGRFDRAEAIAQLYGAKGRPPHKAIPVLIGDLDQLGYLTTLPLAPLAHALVTRFWPGPLTLIVPGLPTLPAILTAGGRTVGVRMPDHNALRALIRQAGPLATTSANRSGEPEARSAAEVLAQLADHIPLVLTDDEAAHPPKPAAMPSTVVDVTDLSTAGPRILRLGPLGKEIEAWLAEMDR